MARRVVVTYKENGRKTDVIKANKWFPEGQWVHFLWEASDGTITPVKDIHADVLASVEFADISGAELKRLEGKDAEVRVEEPV